MNGTKFDYKLFGLEPRDIVVYEAMLNFNEPTSIRTAASTTNFNRGTAFEIIKKLVTVGLVGTHYKNKRRYYAALPPSALSAFAADKQRQMTDELEKVEKYVSRLTLPRQPESKTQFTQFYEGNDEVAALLRDVLETVTAFETKQYHVISSAEISNHIYAKFRNFTRQRIKKGIFANVIAIGEGGEIADLADRRWLTADTIPACYIIIYGDKVAQLSLSETGNVQGVVVQNRGIAQMQRLIFDNLWETLTIT